LNSFLLSSSDLKGCPQSGREGFACFHVDALLLNHGHAGLDSGPDGIFREIQKRPVGPLKKRAAQTIVIFLRFSVEAHGHTIETGGFEFRNDIATGIQKRRVSIGIQPYDCALLMKPGGNPQNGVQTASGFAEARENDLLELRQRKALQCFDHLFLRRLSGQTEVVSEHPVTGVADTKNASGAAPVRDIEIKSSKSLISGVFPGHPFFLSSVFKNANDIEPEIQTLADARKTPHNRAPASLPDFVWMSILLTSEPFLSIILSRKSTC